MNPFVFYKKQYYNKFYKHKDGILKILLHRESDKIVDLLLDNNIAFNQLVTLLRRIIYDDRIK